MMLAGMTRDFNISPIASLYSDKTARGIDDNEIQPFPVCELEYLSSPVTNGSATNFIDTGK